MKIQPYPDNNIKIGSACVMGAIVASNNAPAWIVPGGRYTLSRSRAVEVAHIIHAALSERI